MKKKHIQLLFIILIVIKANSQVIINKAISDSAFKKNIRQDINFIVLGDNNIKQGFTYKLDEKSNELTISGKLYSKRSHIITVDGSLTVDEGKYIFDTKDGSKKGKMDFNIFFPVKIFNSKAYPGPKDQILGGSTNRARILAYLKSKQLKEKAKEEFLILDKIMSDFELPTTDITKKEFKIINSFPQVQTMMFFELDTPEKKKNATSTIEDTKFLKKLSQYYQGKTDISQVKTYAELVKTINASGKEKYSLSYREHRQTKYWDYNIPKEIKIDSLFNDYNRVIEKIKNIDEEALDIEIEEFKSIWIVENNSYIGISPYYERESIETYNNDGTILTFSDRFKEVRGNLYGIKSNLNNVMRINKGLLNGTYWITRGLVTFGRASNYEEFKKKEYQSTTILEQNSNNEISEIQKKTGFYNKTDNPYQYGFYQKYSIENYLSGKHLGIYGIIGYSNNKALTKHESIPFETGLILNLRSEEKNILSVLFFIARENLNIHPKEDMNFGLKVGLPINIKNPNAKIDTSK